MKELQITHPIAFMQQCLMIDCGFNSVGYIADIPTLLCMPKVSIVGCGF